MVGTTEDIVMAKNQKRIKSTQVTPSTLIKKLNFEDSAQQLEALKAHIFNTNESNQARIQFIKEELAAGRYEINSQRIATRLLEHAVIVEEAEIA